MIHYIKFGDGEHSFQLKMHVVAQTSCVKKGGCATQSKV